VCFFLGGVAFPPAKKAKVVSDEAMQPFRPFVIPPFQPVRTGRLGVYRDLVSFSFGAAAEPFWPFLFCCSWSCGDCTVFHTFAEQNKHAKAYRCCKQSIPPNPERLGPSPLYFKRGRRHLAVFLFLFTKPFVIDIK